MGDVLIRHAGYDEDFFLWTQEQAQALRAMRHDGSNSPLDWENIAEEIESLGKSDRRRCESLVGMILLHLLKCQYWPSEEPLRHWREEVRNFRRQLAKVLRDSPSLKARLKEFIEGEWREAVGDALSACQEFLAICKRLDQVARSSQVGFSAVEVMNSDYFPHRIALTMDSVPP